MSLSSLTVGRVQGIKTLTRHLEPNLTPATTIASNGILRSSLCDNCSIYAIDYEHEMHNVTNWHYLPRNKYIVVFC